MKNIGEIREQELSAHELEKRGPEEAAQKLETAHAPEPLVELTTRQVRGVSQLAFTALHRDDSSSSVYKGDELAEIGRKAPLVADLASVLLLTSAASPGGCSCSSSCWG